MTNDHAPTATFRDHLEWEVLRAARREARFSAPVRRSRLGLRTVAIALGCLALGVAGNLASAQVSGSARRDSLTEGTRADLLLLQAQADVVKAQLDLTRRRAAAGAIGREEVANAEAVMRSLDAKLSRLQLNLSEIQQSGLPARDDLTAPRIGVRDYVRERLAVDLAEANARLYSKESILSVIDQRRVAGSVSELTRDEAYFEVSRAQADAMRLAGRELARRDYLEKSLSAEEVARRVQEIDTKAELRLATQSLGLVGRRLDLISKQRSAGGATELEVLKVQVLLKEQELEVARLSEQLKKLAKRP